MIFTNLGRAFLSMVWQRRVQNYDNPPVVLICAYAADPNIPSEPTIGWTFIRSAMRAVSGREVKVVVVTNRRSAQAIYRAFPLELNGNLEVAAVGLPHWLRWLERPRINFLARIEYLLWFLCAKRSIAAMARRTQILLAHHVTFATEMLPTPITAAGKGSFKVWGPVGSDGAADVYRVHPTVRGTGREFWIQALRDKLSAIVAPVLASSVDLVITSQQGKLSKNLVDHNIRAFTFPNLILPEELRDTILSARHAARKNGPSDVLELMLVGHLIPRKRPELAIAALCEPALSKARLNVFGGATGGDDRTLRDMVRRLGLSDRVVFHGTVDRSVILDFMCKSDVLVHPSGREGAVGVIGEATVAGIPVVCFEGTGAALVLRAAGGHGVLVDASSPHPLTEFASAIHRAARLGRGSAADWSAARFDDLELALVDYAVRQGDVRAATTNYANQEVNALADSLWSQP